jgi:hypothetical protein
VASRAVMAGGAGRGKRFHARAGFPSGRRNGGEMNPQRNRWELATCFAIIVALAAAGCAPEGAGPAASRQVYEAAALSGTASWPPLPAPSGKEPKTVVFDRLANLFEPARFDHEAHAGMAKMGKGCAACHHGAEAGPTPACGRCHTVPLDGESQAQLGLKGAFHVQCLRCHRECGSRNDCTSCHFERGAAAAAQGSGFERKAEMLVKKVYETPREKGTSVVFNHKSHADECDGGCSACHKDEACAACHRPAGREPVVLPRVQGEDPHGSCFPCHGKDAELEFDCSDCHEKKK